MLDSGPGNGFGNGLAKTAEIAEIGGFMKAKVFRRRSGVFRGYQVSKRRTRRGGQRRKARRRRLGFFR